MTHLVNLAYVEGGLSYGDVCSERTTTRKGL